MGGIDQLTFPICKAQYVFFRTGGYTRTTADALCRVNVRVNMDRLMQAIFLCLCYLLLNLFGFFSVTG